MIMLSSFDTFKRMFLEPCMFSLHLKGVDFQFVVAEGDDHKPLSRGCVLASLTTKAT